MSVIGFQHVRRVDLVYGRQRCLHFEVLFATLHIEASIVEYPVILTTPCHMNTLYFTTTLGSWVSLSSTMFWYSLKTSCHSCLWNIALFFGGRWIQFLILTWVCSYLFSREIFSDQLHTNQSHLHLTFFLNLVASYMFLLFFSFLD